MSFPWPVFPGLDQDLFPPMVFLVFWDSIPKRCKGAVLARALRDISIITQQGLAALLLAAEPRPASV